MFERKRSTGQSAGWDELLGSDVSSEPSELETLMYQGSADLELPDDDNFPQLSMSDDSRMPEPDSEGETVVFNYASFQGRPPSVSSISPADELPDGFWRAVDGEAQNIEVSVNKTIRKKTSISLKAIDTRAIWAALFFFLLTLGIYKLFFSVDLGVVDVASEPEGATILVDGRDSGFKTPHRFSDLRLGQNLAFSLELPGHKTREALQEVAIEEGSSHSLFFQLYPVKSVMLKTQPGGASIKLDGQAQMGVTPLQLMNLPVGQVSILEIEAHGYLPKRVPIEILSDVEELEYKLEKAIELVVVTEPQGAEVRVNEESIGHTPIYDYKVAADKLINVSIKRTGYVPVEKKIRTRSHKHIELRLQRLSLSKIPLSKEDRAIVRHAERDVSKAKKQLHTAKLWARKAEAKLRRVEANPKASVSALINAKQQMTQAYTHRDEQQRVLQESLDRLDDLSERLTQALP